MRFPDHPVFDPQQSSGDLARLPSLQARLPRWHTRLAITGTAAASTDAAKMQGPAHWCSSTRAVGGCVAQSSCHQGPWAVRADECMLQEQVAVAAGMAVAGMRGAEVLRRSSCLRPPRAEQRLRRVRAAVHGRICQLLQVHDLHMVLLCQLPHVTRRHW